MPTTGEGVAVRLEVAVEGERERWCRYFDEKRLCTIQWCRDGLLMERLGLVVFASALVLEGTCLRYEFRRAWLAGIPLPRWLSPVVAGSTVAGDAEWQVEVHIIAPFLGEVVHYQGWVEPE
jgi:hypothetical protein